MLSVALAATVFCYTLLQGMAGSHITGASSQRRYFTLGVRITDGVNYGIRPALVDQLMQHLPPPFVIAAGFELPLKYGSVTLPDKSKRTDVAVHIVSAHYFQAVDLPDVLGRMITPVDARTKAPVVVINRRCADTLFGSARAALGRELILRVAVNSYHAVPLRVIGVIANAFTGIRAADDYSSHHDPLAWVASQVPIFEPALLSVPTSSSDAEIRHDLDLAWHRLPETVKGEGSHGLVFTRPLSFEPRAVAATVHQLKLYLLLAIAALLLTVVNLIAMNFLEALRRRAVHAIERTLGATRAWQLRRVLYRSLLGTLVTLAVSSALLVAALVVTQRAIAAIHSRASPWWRIGRVLHGPHLLIPALALILAVALIEVLVHQVLLTREQQASSSMQISSPRGEQQVGGVILALEFTLAALLAVLAFWGVSYAWGMAHENLGMLQGQRLTVLSMGSNNAYVSAHPNAFAHMVSNAVLVADLQRAIAGIEPQAEAGFGPVVGFPYRHGAGNFRNYGTNKLEAGQAGIITQGFAASAGWLPVGEVQLLAGRDFSSDNPDPHDILIDAQVARTLFGSVRAAIGRQVHLKWLGKPMLFRVRGVIAPLRLNGPGRASVASSIEPIQGGGNYFMNGDRGNILIRPAIPVARYPALQAAVQRAFAKDAPYLEVTGIQSSAQLLSRLNRPQRVLAMVFGAVAGFGLLIALTGLAVFLRLFLALRRRVDAIRQALGASPRRQYTGVLVGTLALGMAGALLALL
ncbi:MAG: ABC transporter permease, partial [Metallibacterium sp.]